MAYDTFWATKECARKFCLYEVLGLFLVFIDYFLHAVERQASIIKKGTRGMASKVRVKICCISSGPEIRMAIKHGASAVGLVSAMPSGPGVIDDAAIAELSHLVPPGMGSFLLTSKVNPEDIIAQQRFCRVNTLQLVDEVENLSNRW